MYFFYDENRYLIPTYEVSFIEGDLYKVRISHIDNDDSLIRYVMSRDIYETDIKELTKLAVKSKSIRNIESRTKLITLRSLDGGEDTFYICHGGIFHTDSNEGMCTQLLFPKNIMRYKDIIAITDPLSRYSRTLIIPRETNDISLVIRNMSKTHHDIVRYVQENGPSTARRISDGLGININTVRGRITELTYRGILVCYDYDYTYGRRNRIWYFKPNDPMEGLNV